MINLENTNAISSILKDLTSVHENLLLLSNDIWISIDHNDSEKLEECYQFKKEFNQLLDIFEKNKDSICTLVSQFTGVKVEEQPKTIEKDAAENEHLMKLQKILHSNVRQLLYSMVMYIMN